MPKKKHGSSAFRETGKAGTTRMWSSNVGLVGPLRAVRLLSAALGGLCFLALQRCLRTCTRASSAQHAAQGRRQSLAHP